VYILLTWNPGNLLKIMVIIQFSL